MAETTTETQEGFYVTVFVNAQQWAPLLGPYGSHQEALDNVERARTECRDKWPLDSHWWAFGTAKISAEPNQDLPMGRLES